MDSSTYDFLKSMTFASGDCTDECCKGDDLPEDLKIRILNHKRRRLLPTKESDSETAAAKDFYDNLDALASSDGESQSRKVARRDPKAAANVVTIPAYIGGPQKPILEWCAGRARVIVYDIPKGGELLCLGSGVIETSDEIETRAKIGAEAGKISARFFPPEEGDDAMRPVGFVWSGSCSVPARVTIIKAMGPGAKDVSPVFAEKEERDLTEDELKLCMDWVNKSD